MCAQNTLTREYSAFSFQEQDRVAIFRFKGRLLFNAGGFVDSDRLAESLHYCSESPDIRVVILKGVPEKAGSLEYSDFIRHAAASRDKYLIHKMLNFHNQLVMNIVNHRKFVMAVDSGKIISQFFNVSLACDYRLVANNTVVQKAYFEHGLAPKGGGTFFLARTLGRKRAYEILLSEADITAQEALDLGLVDELAPLEDLEDAAMARAQEFAAKPLTTLMAVKKLMNYSLKSLPDYLEFENDVIVNLFNQLRVLD